MRTELRFTIFALTFCVLAFVMLSSQLALAHHAFGGEFDPNKPVLLKGTITKVEWVNPHAWIHMTVKDPDGSTKEWMIEGGTPNTLFRRGITKDSLKVGTDIVVDGYQARDHNLLRANGRNITFPDGRKLFLGSDNLLLSEPSSPASPMCPSDTPRDRARPPRSAPKSKRGGGRFDRSPAILSAAAPS